MLVPSHVVESLTRSGIARVDTRSGGGADNDADEADESGAAGDLTAGLRLRLAFFEATARVRLRPGSGPMANHVFFDGALPPGPGRATLTHQGALSLGQLREQKLGTKAVDDAFIVRCDDDGFALLTQCRDQLLALVPQGAPSDIVSIAIEAEQLRVTWPGAAAFALPALWERLVSLRAGA